MVQTGHIFASELKHIGIDIPPDTTTIKIAVNAYNTPVTISFQVTNFNSNAAKTIEAKVLKNKNGEDVMSQDFYNLIKSDVRLPDEVTEFEIIAEVNKIVEMRTTSAFPTNGLESLQQLFK